MRLAAQVKSGFYPAHPDAVADAIARLDVPETFSVLDPCAGRGDALAQITSTLGGTPFAIELDNERAGECRARFENVLAPASIFGCKANRGGFDLVWLNPPYDDELGGGSRVEHQFLMQAYQWMKPKSVLMFVVPEHINGNYSPSVGFLREKFDHLGVMLFPDHVRRYREIVIFGVKRDRVVEVPAWEMHVPIKHLPTWQRYTVPIGKGPAVFAKCELTQDELEEALAASPLQKALEAPQERPLPRPPLPPGKGHIAMLLASGHMDGIVRPPGEKPHVIRGVAKKIDYLKDCTETEDAESGAVTRKSVYGQKVCLTLRAVDASGDIKTFEQE